MKTLVGNLLKSPIKNKVIQRHSSTSLTREAQESEEEYNRAKQFDQIPQVPSVPLLGSGWTFIPFLGRYNLQRLHRAALDKYQRYGSLVREEITAGATIVNVFEPDDIEKIFRTEGRTPRRLPFESLRRITRSDENAIKIPGLLSAEGEEWYNMRSVAQPHMLKPRNVVNYLPAMDQVAVEFTERLAKLRDEKLQVPNFHKEMTKWALESIALVGLDTRLGSFDQDLPPDSDANKVLNAAFQLFELIYRLEFGMFPFWKKYDTPLFKKFKENILFFNEISMKYLKINKDKLTRKLKDPARRTDEPPTLIELLIQEKGADDEIIGSVIRDMFVAGTDTTSNTMCFFLYFLAKHPEIQEKVYREIRSLVKSENEPITDRHLNEMRYTKACVKESQRLLPVTIGFSRKAGKNIALSGYQVPEGTVLIVHLMVANGLEKNFKDAKSFKPERWLRGSEEQKMMHPFLFIPFGFGPRACIGRRIAEQELYSLIIRLVSRFRLEYHHEDLNLLTRLTNIPDRPLLFQFYDR